MILNHFQPMGIYETLFLFAEVSGRYMGDPGTHPWAQGYPITHPVPGGPDLPDSIRITADDRMYPKADGQPPLREAITRYYNDFYDAGITVGNVAIFAGGRPAIFAILAFLEEGVRVAVEETEYTPYWDVLRLLKRPYDIIPSNEQNRFRPGLADHPAGDGVMLLKSNPCNPTGVTVTGDDLRALVEHYSKPGRSALIDEAYEFYCDPEPESALRYIDDINATDLFIVGAATKGLQVPGMRVGWVVASREHIELFRNYSSFGMGGVSRASQLYVTALLEPKRVAQARRAVCDFFTSQRNRYGEGLANLGVKLYSGNGGFYHWGRLPGDLTGDGFNERLFSTRPAFCPGGCATWSDGATVVRSVRCSASRSVRSRRSPTRATWPSSTSACAPPCDLSLALGLVLIGDSSVLVNEVAARQLVRWERRFGPHSLRHPMAPVYSSSTIQGVWGVGIRNWEPTMGCALWTGFRTLAVVAFCLLGTATAWALPAPDTTKPFPDDWFFEGAQRPPQLKALEGKPAPRWRSASGSGHRLPSKLTWVGSSSSTSGPPGAGRAWLRFRTTWIWCRGTEVMGWCSSECMTPTLDGMRRRGW